LARLGIEVIAQNAAENTERIQEASRYCFAASKWAPDLAVVWVARTKLLREMRPSVEVLEFVKKATQRFPQEPEIWESLGKLLAATNRAQEAVQAYTKAIPRAPETPSHLLDLSAYYNAAFQQNWHNPKDVGNNLELLPRGIQSFNGIQYDVRGVIQLDSQGISQTQPGYPEEVAGIKIGRRCTKLYFLQGAGWTEKDGTAIAKYVVYYDEKAKVEIPVIYGTDLRNWQYWPQMPENEKTGGSIAWQGTQKRWQKNPGWGVRLYQMTWTNPHPENEILTLDFVSAKRQSAPFLIAITVEAPGK